MHLGRKAQDQRIVMNIDKLQQISDNEWIGCFGDGDKGISRFEEKETNFYQ